LEYLNVTYIEHRFLLYQVRKHSMQSRREFLGILPVGLLGVGYATSLEVQSHQGPSLTLSPERAVYRPLDEVTVHGAGEHRLMVLDGEGTPYLDRNVTLPAAFRAGGALGTQTVLLLDADGKLVGNATLQVDARTEIREPSGEYQHLLETL
jgi:hypothetical protein